MKYRFILTFSLITAFLLIACGGTNRDSNTILDESTEEEQKVEQKAAEEEYEEWEPDPEVYMNDPEFSQPSSASSSGTYTPPPSNDYEDPITIERSDEPTQTSTRSCSFCDGGGTFRCDKYHVSFDLHDDRPHTCPNCGDVHTVHSLHYCSCRKCGGDGRVEY